MVSTVKTTDIRRITCEAYSTGGTYTTDRGGPSTGGDNFPVETCGRNLLGIILKHRPGRVL